MYLRGERSGAEWNEVKKCSERAMEHKRKGGDGLFRVGGERETRELSSNSSLPCALPPSLFRRNQPSTQK